MLHKVHFDTKFSFEKSIHIIQQLSQEILDVKHPISILINERNYIDLINYKVDYSIQSRSEIRAIRQVLAFFQKNADLPVDINTQDVALQGFLQAEEICRETNRRLRRKSTHPDWDVDDPLYFRVSQKIASILGPCPDISTLDFGFGPGANVGVSRLTSIRRKLSSRPTCTANAWKHLTMLQDCYPHWDLLKKAVPAMAGNLTFVPKSAKTDRSIVIEPVVNTFLQKGVGNSIRNLLKRAGCNLSSQEKNQYGALLGSRDGTLCTADLSMASDTISREVVKALLPYDWWLLLEDVRSPDVKLPNGDIIHLQKFSSMGNGFTFELESLIFYAICLCITDKGDFVSVYGDDIVIPTKHFSTLQYALGQFGFLLNEEKSYCSGEFRESCGRDYFGGIDVRPCYVKDRLSIKEVFRLHNFFKRNFESGLADVLLKYVPKRFRIFGPDGFGDGHLLDHNFRCLRHNLKKGWGGGIFRTFTAKPYIRREPLVGDYSALLYVTDKKRNDNKLFSHSAGRLRPADIDDIPPTSMIYMERSLVVRYRLSRIYTLEH